MERLDFLVNEFMQQHNLKVDDLYDYLVARKKREKVIPITKANLTEIKAGMYWYGDDTVSDTYYPDRRLKSLVLAIYEDHIIGDTFFEKSLLKYDWAMCEIGSFTNKYIPRGHAHKPTLRDIEQICDNNKVINAALKAIDKPQWRFSYWTNSINKYENDWYKKEQKWHYIVSAEEKFKVRTAPDFEKANVRPLLLFELKY